MIFKLEFLKEFEGIYRLFDRVLECLRIFEEYLRIFESVWFYLYFMVVVISWLKYIEDLDVCLINIKIFI